MQRIAALIACLLLVACARRPEALPGFPRVFVWAWEHPEDLRSLDTRAVGVAFLARTVSLAGGRVAVRPRMQPLHTPPGTVLMAVVRVESAGRAAAAPLSDAAGAIAGAIGAPGVRALQVDFDAVASERSFYRRLLAELRRRLPPGLPISVTALASWCQFDGWISDLPVAEAVPMLFRMGPDHYAPGSDFHAALCRSSVGVSTDELPLSIPAGRRVYIFHPGSWSPGDLSAALRKANQWQRGF